MKNESIDWAEVGGRIKRLRRDNGLSQKGLAGSVASASLLSLIESGARRPSRQVLDHIADRLGVQREELLTGRPPGAEVGLELRLLEARNHLRAGEVDAAVEVARDLVSTAEEMGLVRIEAKAYEVLASTEEYRGLLESALELFRKAEALWADEPLHLRFETVAGIARCQQFLGNTRLAVHMLESYLLALEQEGVPDPRATMRIHSSLARCYSALGLPGKAAEAAETAQALTPRVSDGEQLACMNMNVARSLHEQGRASDALEALRMAEQAFLSLGWEVDAAQAKMNRSIVQIEKGDFEDARENLRAAVETLKSVDHHSGAGKALNELGRLERISGDAVTAEKLLLQAQDYLDGGDFSERALNLRELGQCLQERDPDQAKGYLRRAIDLYMLSGSGREVATTYKLLGDLHRGVGEIEQSAECFRAGIEAVEGKAEDLLPG